MDKEEINKLEGSSEEITSNASGKLKLNIKKFNRLNSVQDYMVDCVQNDHLGDRGSRTRINGTGWVVFEG